jgi:hypothetical protein
MTAKGGWWRRSQELVQTAEGEMRLSPVPSGPSRVTTEGRDDLDLAEDPGFQRRDRSPS